MDYDFALQCLGVELEKVVREHKKDLEKFKEERMSEKIYRNTINGLREVAEEDWVPSKQYPGYDVCNSCNVFRKAKPKPYTETITWYPHPECTDDIARDEIVDAKLDDGDFCRQTRMGTVRLCTSGRVVAVARTPKGEKCQS